MVLQSISFHSISSSLNHSIFTMYSFPLNKLIRRVVLAMQGMINLTRWIFSILLLLGAIIHIDIFSLIYILIFLAIPWTLIHSTIIRWRLFFIFSLIALIISLAFLLITTSLHLLFITRTDASIFNMNCSSNVRILHHLGLMLWTYTTNKTLFVVIIIVHVMIGGKK